MSNGLAAWNRSWGSATVVLVLLWLGVSASSAEMVLRPEEFGAKGDGIADDTKSIQQCIDQIAALPANANGHKGTVVLDQIYYVTRQVQVIDDTTPEHKVPIGPHWRIFHVPSGVTIDGKGTVTLLQNGMSSRENPTSYTYVFWISLYSDRCERSVKLAKAAEKSNNQFPTNPNELQTYLRKNDPEPTATLDDGGVHHVTIRNITIVNDPASLYPPYSETSAINVKYGQDVHVDSVKFRHWHRGVIMMRPAASTSVTNCVIEDSRYIGVAVYSVSAANGDDVCRIENNIFRGNTQLSGGIYISGGPALVRGNTLHFTHGIFGEGLSDSVVENNHISRSPYGIRIGYLAGGGASRVQVRGNRLAGCVGGIMVANATDVRVEHNVIEKFIAFGSDVMIEPPNGYWGFGRERVGINVEDCADSTIATNQVKDLSDAVPVGIRVVNSRFTADYAQGGYGVTDANDPPGMNVNNGIQVVGNHVEASGGLAVAYYAENQSSMTFTDNNASGDSGGRLIGCSGTIERNALSGKLSVVNDASENCRRLIFKNHPTHWDGIPQGNCGFKSPPPVFVEFVPPIPMEVTP